MEIGDKVERKEGLRMPGVVRAMFRNRDSELRVVVEGDTELAESGPLIIYSPDELRVTKPRVKPDASTQQKHSSSRAARAYDRPAD